jgi:hypothetical protein
MTRKNRSFTPSANASTMNTATYCCSADAPRDSTTFPMPFSQSPSETAQCRMRCAAPSRTSPAREPAAASALRFPATIALRRFAFAAFFAA